MEMAAYIRKDRLDDAARLKVEDCMSCGGCSYACPSHIPLMHYFEYAKGLLKAQHREGRRHERFKMHAEARRARMEKQARLKAEAAARKARPAPAESAPCPQG
jgi:electron transport complex protein RnfC